MKILGCCIAKNENRYIKEWLDYHFKIGFSQIVIYDNNDDNSLLSIIDNYVKNNKVIVEDFRRLKAAQTKAYSECYSKYNTLYDYIMFFDCDEFIQLSNKFSSIADVISQPKFSNAKIIRLCWKVFGDSNLTTVKNNDYSVQTRFTIPSTFLNYNHYYKSLIKCKNIQVKTISAHGCYDVNDDVFYTNGEKCQNKCSSELLSVYDDIWINHYHTKTIEEFINQKVNRGDASNAKQANNTTIDFFFKINSFTNEKQIILNKLLNN